MNRKQLPPDIRSQDTYSALCVAASIRRRVGSEEILFGKNQTDKSYFCWGNTPQPKAVLPSHPYSKFHTVGVQLLVGTSKFHKVGVELLLGAPKIHTVGV